MLLQFLLLSAIFILFVIVWLIRYWASGLPPGPIPLPVIGNLHQIMSKGTEKIHLTLTELGKKYGDIYTVYIGGTPWIILSSYDAIKESKREFMLTAKPYNVILDEVSQRKGIAGAEGKNWQDQRRFAVVHLRELGFGKVSFEDKIHEEVTKMLEAIHEEGGKPFNIRTLITSAVANIICSIVLGNRYEYTDSRLPTFIHAVNSVFEDLARASMIATIFPWVRFLPGDLLNYKKIMGHVKKVDSFLQAIIDEHKKTLDQDSIRDFIDSYLVKIQQENGKHDTTFTENQLLKVIAELFAAGLETTSTSLYWALLFLTLHPDIQNKARQEIRSTQCLPASQTRLGTDIMGNRVGGCFREIDDVVGRNRLPSVRDRQNLPYMEALMAEVLRAGNIAAVGLLHCSAEDMMLRGYKIPARTTVIANYTSTTTDDHLYKNPDVFDPQRFLDDNNKFKKPESFIPFSLGRRSCLGESLARMEIFLFLSAMLQKFTFCVPDGEAPPSTEGVNGLTHSPRPYKLCIKPRV